MASRKKNDRPPHQKSRILNASKGDLSLDIWTSKKALEHFLWNIYLMLDFLYHKRNLLFTTVVHRGVFFKYKTSIWGENVLRKYYFSSVIIMIKWKHICIRRNSFGSKMILLNISIIHGKSNFLRLHNFTKCFSDSRVNQIVNKCLNG